MTAPVLELQEVTRTFPTEAGDVAALRGVSLAVQQDDYLAVLGASGSGKSTLLALLGLLDRPTDGAVFVRGTAAAGLPDRRLAEIRRENIGFVFQQFHLIPYLDALHNVAAALSLRGLRRRERLDRAGAALVEVGLEHRLRHRPAQLSGGEQQRVAIARAFAAAPLVLLADEPTGNLDRESGNGVIEAIERYHRGGAAVVMVTHNERVAARARRRVELTDGVLRELVRR